MSLYQERRAKGRCPLCGSYSDNGKVVCSRCRERVDRADRGSNRRKEYQRRVKQECFAAYGGRCRCCSLTNPDFLTIDHIQGGGTQHVQELRRQGFTLYLYLRREGYPSGYQVLCWNCNLVKHQQGDCQPANHF